MTIAELRAAIEEIPNDWEVHALEDVGGDGILIHEPDAPIGSGAAFWFKTGPA